MPTAARAIAIILVIAVLILGIYKIFFGQEKQEEEPRRARKGKG